MNFPNSFLKDPDVIQLDDAYRGMQKLTGISVKTSNLQHIVKDMEKVGFVGMVIKIRSGNDAVAEIEAFKGKHGPCHFTGWQAQYTGFALAVLDDDHHVLYQGRSVPVCDKTLAVYSLAPYSSLIKCEKKGEEITLNTEQKEKQEGEDFETSLEKVFEQLRNVEPIHENRTQLFYPGPFRMLILADGTMVQRGEWSRIPDTSVNQLIKTDGLVKLEPVHQASQTFFQKVYTMSGSMALLDDFQPQSAQKTNHPLDYSILPKISQQMRTRILKMLDENKKYFILIGNDAEDRLGCCPSAEVSEANLLVRHGILDAFGEPVQGDSCPVTLYSFRDEMRMTETSLTGDIDNSFRQNIRSKLLKSTSLKFRQLAKWVLLLFIGFSIVLAVRKCDNLQSATAVVPLSEQLNPQMKNQVQVVLFHNEKRCYQCLQMEEKTMELLHENFNKELINESVTFKTVIIDDLENINIVNRFGIFGPTIVLLEFNRESLEIGKVLYEATTLYRDEKAFKSHLEAELQQLLTE